ncbi:Regulator of G-protein signaling 2 [Nakaseomyces bracarensis]|uniref:Regulator of G-protein signaling 2 n=1 Tax=Nakaseomyces bracarensis TaxID=273131 RepID=A0ABR4NV32_9SACH
MSIPTLYDILLQPGNNSTEESKVYNIETFHKFLLKAHCEENLEFFQYTNSYICSKNKENDEDRNSRSEADLADSSSRTSKLLKLWNNRIYLRYIALNSPRECNFPQEIREVFEKCYREGTLPSDENVLVAMQHILQLLMDAYRQFTKFVNDCDDPVEELVTEKHQAIITNFGENDSVSSIISKDESYENKKTEDFNWSNSKEAATTYWGMGNLTYPQANYLMTPKVNLSANDLIFNSTAGKLAPSVSPLINREISDLMNKNSFSPIKRKSGEYKDPIHVIPMSPKRRSVEVEKRKSGSPILVSPTSKLPSTKFSKSNGSNHVNRTIKSSTSPLSHRDNSRYNDSIKRPISPPINHLPHEHHSNTIVGKSKQLLTKLGMVGRKKNYASHEVVHHTSNSKLT